MMYTNNTIRVSDVTQEYSLGMTTNYSVIKDEPNEVVLDNLTTPEVKQELITYRRSTIPTVNSELNIQYPAPKTGGVRYAVQVEEVVRETRGDGTYVDHPVVMYLTVRHPLSGAITESVLQETFERLLSTLRRESDNTYRFKYFMRGTLKPEVS